ncbi:hypothetical protein ACSFA3_00715 [Variovorax sp. RHLX14]|uniref:hypothetical protein n=1 Tax=Variovorax sp. RHLX14 TaxID=1259731 RepID=UPI003F44E407
MKPINSTPRPVADGIANLRADGLGRQTKAPTTFSRLKDRADSNPLQAAAMPNALGGLSPWLQEVGRKQPTMRAKLEAAGTVIDVLAKNKIFAEIGGSLAALSLGGIRDPANIDIQVGNKTDFGQAYSLLGKLDVVAQMPDGRTARVQGQKQSLIPGASGSIDLNFSYSDGKKEKFPVNLSQENSALVFPKLAGSGYTGRIGVPSTSTAPRLVAGCLGRYMDDPKTAERKQDLQQIAAMLRHSGVDLKDPAECSKLVKVIGQEFTESESSRAESQLTEILGWMKAGKL